ncbi:DUF3289 family protein [Siccibacter colletis]|uniref:DUF3289 family protein n=1 Tax=Siccibacter colletis TaxID=1505757 RepID=UPI0028BE928F|nr:DUF3289 family protein [Siccibacter colletis]WNN47714.1 DUF3289 family protein [Siccibacter colletis]
MSIFNFPVTLFKTQNRVDDYSANDMRYGDLSEAVLRRDLMLDYISDSVDPYSLTRRSSFDTPQSMFCCNNRPQDKTLTLRQCSDILFNEFRKRSREFSIYGPYRHMIIKMIDHMQNGNGKPFSDMYLDSALHEHITSDRSTNSSLLHIKSAINDCINWKNKSLPRERIIDLTNAIQKSKLPKFDRFQDNFNGMGLTIHDTWATEILLDSLVIDNYYYRAKISYYVQDHFGLDSTDILRKKFNQFLLFRIWFVLQHYNKFAFKPFMTNMKATVEIDGTYRNDNK